MSWLNYHHLLYFWTVAREGSIAKASRALRLAQPTISGQIKTLEASLGEKLFEREGRGLVLTSAGTLVLEYADEIFALGRELTDTFRGQPNRLRVGISHVVPKLVSYRLLEPALAMDPPVQLVCTEATTEPLLAGLAVRTLDLVITDGPMGPQHRVRAFNHLLGECGVSFFAVKALAGDIARGFPRSLNGAPMLLPTRSTIARVSLDHWLEEKGVRPRIVAELEDSALLKVFGQRGIGVFPAPSVIEDAIIEQHEVEVVGRTLDVRERFYAISAERRIKHPAVARIHAVARHQLFS